mmetsp:Transcript_56126/g.174012  ORF Transcript_56126/g.174012 Transcript_56126/m.174012 type:complete len:239 (-) Transcript_56126:97-813(-)
MSGAASGDPGLVNLAALSAEVQIPEAKAFYVVQLAMENIHSECYSLLIDLLFCDPSEKEAVFYASSTMPPVRQKVGMGGPVHEQGEQPRRELRRSRGRGGCLLHRLLLGDLLAEVAGPLAGPHFLQRADLPIEGLARGDGGPDQRGIAEQAPGGRRARHHRHRRGGRAAFHPRGKVDVVCGLIGASVEVERRSIREALRVSNWWRGRSHWGRPGWGWARACAAPTRGWLCAELGPGRV